MSGHKPTNSKSEKTVKLIKNLMNIALKLWKRLPGDKFIRIKILIQESIEYKLKVKFAKY